MGVSGVGVTRVPPRERDRGKCVPVMDILGLCVCVYLCWRVSGKVCVLVSVCVSASLSISVVPEEEMQ